MRTGSVHVVFLVFALAAGIAWTANGGPVDEAAATFELSHSGGLRLVFDVDRPRDEAVRVDLEPEDRARVSAASATATTVSIGGRSPQPREDIVRQVSRTLGKRLDSFTGRIVLPHVEGDRVFVDLPERAVQSFRQNGSPERLRGLFRIGHVEFRIVDDRDRGLAARTPRPPGIDLDW